MTGKTISCTCCDWKGLSYRYPSHLLTNHPARIQRIMSQGDHCMYFGIGESDCYVCLTCKKGSIHTEVGRVGDRWVAMHSREKTCRDAHPDAFSAFKQRWMATRTTILAEEKAAREAAAIAAASVPVPEGDVRALWTKCRGNRRMAAYLQEVEDRLRGLHEFDEEEGDFVFDPVAGFESIIAEAMDSQKTVKLTKQKMTEMVVDHEHTLTDHRRVVSHLNREVTGLRETVTEQAGKMQDMQSEMQDMQAELQALREELAALKKSPSMAAPPNPASPAGVHGVGSRPAE
jgi:hypothetical protein